MPDYLQHGRRHATGGSDPIPGLGSANLPTAMVRRTGTQTITAGASTPLIWQQSAISDATYYTWGGSSNLTVQQAGVYVCWFSITADADWPASAAGYIQWDPSVSGAGNYSTVVMQPFGAHTNIDVFSPSFATSGGISTVSFIHISNAPANVTGVVQNETSSSFVVGVLPELALYRLCDFIDFS